MRTKYRIDKILTRKILDKYRGKTPLYIVSSHILYSFILADILFYEKYYGDRQPYIIIDTEFFSKELVIELLLVIRKQVLSARILRINNLYHVLREITVSNKTIIIITRREPDLETYIKIDHLAFKNKVYILLSRIRVKPLEYLFIKWINNYLVIKGVINGRKIEEIVSREYKQKPIDIWLT